MKAEDIASLNARYGIPGQATFIEADGGLCLVQMKNARAVSRLTLQGAQLLEWMPLGQDPVIWLSSAARFEPGKAIRGGIPVCWPWFGPHDSQASLPAHGFARTAPWMLDDVREMPGGMTQLDLRLEQQDATHAWWPHPSVLELHVSVGAKLELDLVTHNTGDRPFTVGAALHSYFVVSDIRRVEVHGLDGCSYLDKVDGGQRKQQTGPVTFSAETDRIYLGSVDDCLIDDPVLQRRIRISKTGSCSTVVWNPWADKSVALGDMGEDGYLRMVCVESGNVADDVVTIAPGHHHRLHVSYGVESR